MLKLKFNKFIERYKLQVEADKRSTLHYDETDEMFTIYFKNYEYWEYYTEILKSEIIEFSSMYNATPEDAIKDFKLNYLYHAVILDSKEQPIDNIKVEEKPQELSEPLPEINKSTDADIDVEYEAKDYEEFMINIINGWEKKVVAALNKIDMKDIPEKAEIKGYVNKTFGEFVSAVFNNVHTRKFLVGLKRIIRNSMGEAINSVEEETEVNIGWNDTYDNKLKTLENQQLNGYMINGKQWYGIKGASQDLRQKILQSVQEDVSNQVSRDKMVENIQGIFKGSTTSQAKRIARTETTRFINETKLTSYVDSEIKGLKAWSSVLDNNTGDVDRRLHNKYFGKGIPYDEEFVDDVTGKRYMNPPAHPNCRCAIEYRISND